MWPRRFFSFTFWYFFILKQFAYCDHWEMYRNSYVKWRSRSLLLRFVAASGEQQRLDKFWISADMGGRGVIIGWGGGGGGVTKVVQNLDVWGGVGRGDGNGGGEGGGELKYGWLAKCWDEKVASLLWIINGNVEQGRAFSPLFFLSLFLNFFSRVCLLIFFVKRNLTMIIE